MRFFIAVLQLSIILCYDTLKILKSGLDRGPIIKYPFEYEHVASPKEMVPENGTGMTFTECALWL